MAGAFLWLLLVGFPASPDGQDPLSRAESLIEQGRLDEAERLMRQVVGRQPNDGRFDLLMGQLLARQDQPEKARSHLEKAARRLSNNFQAHVELAGVCFRLKEYQRAEKSIRRALSLKPSDEYSHEFLAAVLYLQGNLVGALDHWNQLGQPRVRKIAYAGADNARRLPRLNEGEILSRETVLEADWRRQRLQLGNPVRWELAPADGNEWDLQVSLPPKLSPDPLKTFLLGNSARALLRREVVFDFDDGGGTSFSTALRWDASRNGAAFSSRTPFLLSDNDILRLGAALRTDWWRSSGDHGLEIQNQGVSANYEYLLGGRKSVSLMAGYQHYSKRVDPTRESPHLGVLGLGWNQRIGLNDSDTIRLEWKARLRSFSGFGGGSSGTAQILSGLRVSWAGSEAANNEVTLTLVGTTSGRGLPLDHHPTAGIGQDDALPLRAHPTIRDGRRGYGAMGRHLVVTNVDVSRRLTEWRGLRLTGLLFSDTAYVAGRPFTDEPAEWLQDVGGGLRFGFWQHNFIDVIFGFDTVRSSFNVWVGLPLAPSF